MNNWRGNFQEVNKSARDIFFIYLTTIEHILRFANSNSKNDCKIGYCLLSTNSITKLIFETYEFTGMVLNQAFKLLKH